MKLSEVHKKRIVLIGGGHSHCLVLKKWNLIPEEMASVCLISESSTSPYSGMMTGAIAGIYQDEDINIALAPLIDQVKGSFIEDSVVDIDFDLQQVLTRGGLKISYDILSINTGALPHSAGILSAIEFAVPLKPVKFFQAKFSEFLKKASESPKIYSVMVIGAGVAGIECALAIESRGQKMGLRLKVQLIETQRQILTELTVSAQENFLEILKQRRIEIKLGQTVKEITDREVIFKDQSRCPAHFVILATSALPPMWVQSLNLEHDGPFIKINEFLETSRPQVFATGDVARNPSQPVSRAGVFAVRQAPVLFQNIKALLGLEKKHSFKPQKNFLRLISDGHGKSFMTRGNLFFTNSKLMWLLKNSIDQKFMDQFKMNKSLPRKINKRYLQITLILTLVCLIYSNIGISFELVFLTLALILITFLL